MRPSNSTPLLSRWLLLGLATLLLVIAASAAIWAGTTPAGAQDGYEPDQDVIADLWDYARETDHGFDHVLRWLRALKTFGEVQDMTAAEAQGYADQHLPERWDPVAAELEKLEAAPGDYEPDPEVIADVWTYAEETDSGYDHVLRWMRALKTLGAIEDMTAAEAQGYADQFLPERWDPVVAELKKLEAAAAAPEPPPAPTGLTATGGDAAIELRWTDPADSAITKYQLRVSADGGASWNPDWTDVSGSGAATTSHTLTGLANDTEYTIELRAFRAETAGPAASATATPSEPASEPTPEPNRAPVVNAQADRYADFVGRQNAPRGTQVSKVFEGIFSDPDGDTLTYSVSVPADRGGLVETLGAYEAPWRVTIKMDGDDDWKAASPALPDPLVTTVTLTAMDPDGLSASVSGDFFTDWESHPALVSAWATPRQAIELTFDQAVEDTPALAPGQFTVNVVNADGSNGTVAVSSASVSDNVVTLELASALQEGQTVTLDYAHDDDAPLQRASGGGDSAPSFTGQAVAVDVFGPVFAAAAVSRSTLTVTFNEELDAGSAPAGSAFTVTARLGGAAARSIAGTGTASVEGAVVTVALAEAVLGGDTVTVAYAPPGEDPVRDLAGNAAVAFSGEPVANETPGDAPTPTPASEPGDVFDVQRRSTKGKVSSPRHPNLDSDLNRLLENVAAGKFPKRTTGKSGQAGNLQSVAVTLYVSDGYADAVESYLKANGASVRNTGADYIEAYVPVALLVRVSQREGVVSVQTIVPPRSSQDTIVSGGVAAHGVSPWHTAGYKGSGVKIGIIDLGFMGFAGLQGERAPIDRHCEVLHRRRHIHIEPVGLQPYRSLYS